jgi:hypothetical protein
MVFVGEGEAEKAFLQHLKSLYGVGSLKVSPKSAGGKGPDNVINDAIGTLENSKCDTVAVLLDTDIPWPPKLKKKSTEASNNINWLHSLSRRVIARYFGRKAPNPE